jgi:transcriptional regulator with XRE-family HTH domain
MQPLNWASMGPPATSTPKEFGDALRSVRTASGVTLEAIAERTKISIHALRALESGDLTKLPNRVFARMFLRQYLGLVEAPQAEWLQAFEACWQRVQESSQSFPVRSPAPVRRRRLGPWVVGLAIVGIGVVTILFVERDRRGTQSAPAAPLQVPAAAPPPATPVPVETPPATPAAPAPGVLVVRTGDLPCWVEVRIAGERPMSRLMEPRTIWDVAAGGKEADLVFGNAGAASVEYMGEVRSPAGTAGAVARIHLSGSQQTGAPR